MYKARDGTWEAENLVSIHTLRWSDVRKIYNQTGKWEKNYSMLHV
jgi:hypothetical protein